MCMALFFSAVVWTEEIATVYTGYPLIKLVMPNKLKSCFNPVGSTETDTCDVSQ